MNRDTQDIIIKNTNAIYNQIGDIVGGDKYVYYNNSALPLYPMRLTSSVPKIDLSTFVGRENEIREAISLLQSGNNTVFLNGVAGIGKTAMMQAVCNIIMRDDSTCHVAWIECGDSLESDLLQLRSGLYVSDNANRLIAYDEILLKLRNIQGQTYLFFDNIERPLNLETLSILNNPNIHIMFTSRSSEAEGFMILTLDALDENLAIELFYRYYKRDEKKQYYDTVRFIVNAIKRHTLLVELLAKAAKYKDTTLEEFNEELKQKGIFKISVKKLHTMHDRESTIEETVINLYKMASLSKEQQLILQLFTIFPANTSIYGKAVDWAGYGEDEIDKRNQLDQIINLGWLKRVDDGYYIHQIVKDSVERQINGVVSLDNYSHFYLDVTESLYSYAKVGYIENERRIIVAESVLSLLEKTDTLFNEKAYLCMLLSDSYQLTGKYFRYVELKAKYYLYIGIEEISKSNNKDIAHINEVIGMIFSSLGGYDEAIYYYKQSLCIKKERFGEKSVETAETLWDIAKTYDLQGSSEKAIELYTEVLEIRERILGVEHEDTWKTHIDLARIYRKVGEYSNSKKHYGKAAVYSLLSHHQEHERILNEEISLLIEEGVYDVANSYYAMRLSMIDEDTNPIDVYELYSSIASLLIKQKHYEIATTYLENATSIQEKLIGDNRGIYQAYIHLGEVHCLQGNHEKAIEYYEKARDILERSFGGIVRASFSHMLNSALSQEYAALGDTKKQQYYKERSIYSTEKLLDNYREELDCFKISMKKYIINTDRNGRNLYKKQTIDCSKYKRGFRFQVLKWFL